MWIPVQKINYLCLFIILSIYRFDGFSQQQEKARAASDSAHVKGGALPVRADSTIAIQKDTTFQTTPPSALPSETKIRSDSTRPKATKSWISQKIHEAIFAPSPAPQADSAEFIKSENIFLPYEGRVIANIRLKKIEVLAGSVDDTLKAVESGFSRVLNSLSIPTKDHVIFNNLTFKVGERLSPSKMADSERLLRDLPFLEDARILVSPRDDSSQAVDAVIITKDRFPVGADLSVKQVNAFHAGVYDRNLIGYGTELRYTYFFDDDGNPRDRHEINYITTNIRGSFISGRLDYRQDVKTENLIISFDKKFLTPETKYGGGLDLGLLSGIQKNGETISTPAPTAKSHFQDLWAGRSFLIKRHDHRENIIVSARVRSDKFSERPFVSADSNGFLHNNNLLLGRISYRKVDYYKSSLILSFGPTEDVPYGYLFQLTGGYHLGEYTERPYLGIEMSGAGLWEPLGYFNVRTQFGSFLNEGKLEQGVFKIGAIYFTKLADLGNFKLRHTATLALAFGIHRLPGETLSLGDKIRGLPNDHRLEGDKSLVLNQESVAFAPWNFYGFRFALFTFVDLGVITPDQDVVDPDHFYGAVGIGCRIRNESLVFNTLNFRFGYLLRAPEGVNRWGFDYSTTDPSVIRTIDLIKPDIVGFENVF